MQETRERQPTAGVWLVRLLLLLLAAVLVMQPLCPAARAAGNTRYVVPLGKAVGIKLFAEGVLVVGLSDLPIEGGVASPARASGLRAGDVITHIDGQPVNSIEEVQQVIKTLRGKEMSLRVMRGNEERNVTAKTALCSTDGVYKLGAWIRDSMAGIGTLTFAEPSSGLFATLGHGINDMDTAVLMKLQRGSITPASIAEVVRGENGRPGELRGCFAGSTELGTLYANTESGVFGILSDKSLIAGEPVAVAAPEEVHTGPATILSNLEGDTVTEYNVEIVKVYHDPSDTRDLMLKVTDDRLLEKTGGIVQGMSGSPVLQDGKLVGAVTHVLIDHADRGYGILAENMLKAAETK